MKHTGESTEYDVEKIRVAKTVGSNEVESEELSTANEGEIDSKSKRYQHDIWIMNWINHLLHIKTIAHDDPYCIDDT